MNIMLPKYLTVDEVMAILRYKNKESLYRKLRKGTIKGHKIGKVWLIEPQDLYDYLGITE